jgi:hypothetical protein
VPFSLEQVHERKDVEPIEESILVAIAKMPWIRYFSQWIQCIEVRVVHTLRIHAAGYSVGLLEQETPESALDTNRAFLLVEKML